MLKLVFSCLVCGDWESTHVVWLSLGLIPTLNVLWFVQNWNNNLPCWKQIWIHIFFIYVRWFIGGLLTHLFNLYFKCNIYCTFKICKCQFSRRNHYPIFFSVRLKFIVIIFPYTKWWNFFILHKAVVYYTSSEVLHHFCHLLLQILRLRALFVAGTHRDMVCALITDRTSAEWSSLSGITEEIKKRAGNRRLSSCHARPFCVTPCGV